MRPGIEKIWETATNSHLATLDNILKKLSLTIQSLHKAILPCRCEASRFFTEMIMDEFCNVIIFIGFSIHYHHHILKLALHALLCLPLGVYIRSHENQLLQKI
jgi:hypothetical protein